MTNGLWILASKNRIPSLERFFDAAHKTGMTTGGIILINKDELETDKDKYDTLQLPAGWRIEGIEGNSLCDALRNSWHLYRDLDWIGWLCDDLIPVTPNWDKALIEKTNGFNVICSDDAWQAPRRMQGAVVWSGPLLRAVGYISPPGLKHMYVDNVWEELGEATGCLQYDMGTTVKHFHAMIGGTNDETTKHTNSFWHIDTPSFEKWQIEEKPKAIERIKVLKASTQSRKTVDFKGLRIMIGTPSMDGTVNCHYLTSLLAMQKVIAEAGAEMDLHFERYNADLPSARALIVSAFLRSPCTHLLFIDADMGWPPHALPRMLYAGKDFVAVAGPKKTYPLQFAVNVKDELSFSAITGTCQIEGVGLAFALLSRSMLTRMMKAYPDVHYQTSDGMQHGGLFLPLLITEPDGARRHLAEDLALCRRWTDIGGEIHICPDIALKHTGYHTFEGAFGQIRPRIAQEEPEQATG